MPNQTGRQIQDTLVNPATFTLPSAISLSVTGPALDLGADTFKSEHFDLELDVPALSATIAPSAATAGFTFAIETSTTSTFAAIARTIVSKTVAGSASGIAAQTLKCRVPADCERYVRGKVTSGATTTDASALNAQLTVRF